MGPPRRRVVYLVVDGINRDAFEQVVASGKAPAFAFLKDNSTYVRDLVATFPTITPAASASLVTGAVPAAHGIPGMCWYDRDAQRFVNYGQSPRAAVVEGLSQIVRDVLVNLNGHHLSADVPTIHEQLDRLGVTTASVNFMVFRGPYTHEVHANVLARLFFRKHLPRSLRGPKEHYFADVVTGPTEACTNLLSKRGLEKRIRATDGWAACVTRELLEESSAGMILFYLHENDHRSHRGGPTSQVDSLAEADKHVAHVLDAFGSWDRAIEEVGFVVTGDHSQSPIADDDDHVLELDDVLGEFERVRPGRGKSPMEDRDIAGAGNGRAGFVYVNSARRERLLPPVIDALRAARGIDQVMWRDGDAYVVDSARGRLAFRPARAGGVVDERGNRWSYEGDLGAVDGVIGDGEIVSPEYPLAMWRIKSALDLARIGDVVFTLRLTYAVKDLAGADHRGGGDHASLHAQDSIVPLLSTLDNPPARPSTVDVVPHIVRHFERADSR